MNIHTAKAAAPGRRFDPALSSFDRQRQIAEAAFFLAEHRDFVPGRSVEDWLAAEREINAACGLIEPEPRWDAA